MREKQTVTKTLTVVMDVPLDEVQELQEKFEEVVKGYLDFGYFLSQYENERVEVRLK